MAAWILCVLLSPHRALAQAEAGTSLLFNGSNNFVQVEHNLALNAYPLTITAWVKTAKSSNQFDGIISKYFPGGADGFVVALYAGRLRAFYFRNGANYVWNNAGDQIGVDGGFIADGHWHHIAFVVGPSGGSLYVDGNLGGSLTWTGTPGPPQANTLPLYFGRYSTSPSLLGNFPGEIDEITMWNRALSPNELNYWKHRELRGIEEGLIGYWQFNEGSGTTLASSITPAYNGSLSNNPVWTESHAAVALQSAAGNSLRFDGANGYVQVPHETNLNAYPLTATAWFRTTDTANNVQGLVSKYQDASFNGWAIIVQNGKLRAFYARPGSLAMDATSAANVNDGAWHHAAMIVDASGGRLYLDGTLVGSGVWSAGAGAPSSTEPLQIGRYYNYAPRFAGTIDEVTVWNRSFTPVELLQIKNLRLTGSETNLLGYWRFDEPNGTIAIDSSGHARDGTLVSAPIPARIGSSALLGDGSVHLVAGTSIASWSKQFAINTVPSSRSFTVGARGFVRRFFDGGVAPTNISITTMLSSELREANGGPVIPTTVVPTTNMFTMSSYDANTPQPIFFGSIASLSGSPALQPQSGVQLDSVNKQYEANVTLMHSVNSGAFENDGADITPAARLLHFNGRVMFGGLSTILSNVVNTPTPGTITIPSHVQTSLQLATIGAYMELAPAVTFGGGAAFNVNLAVDGTATNLNGSFSMSGAGQFFETAGIRYRMPGLTLNASGAVATNLEAFFPTGFGMMTNATDRVQFPFASRTNIVLGPNLVPTASTILFPASLFSVPTLYFAEESKPLRIAASQIQWDIAQGQFQIVTPTGVRFIRQTEDEVLAANRAILVNPSDADRVSNDGYFQNVTNTVSNPIYVRPDTNGASLLTLQTTLRGTAYRPHFPYSPRTANAHVPVTGGALVITDGAIDVTNSFLALSNPVLVNYARDCPPEGGCSTAPTIGPLTLQFTAQGNQLNFTRDGGFIAFGAIPPANLTWGFIGGGNYAQRTSDVQDGGFVIPGISMRGNQTAAPREHRAGALLLSGWGDANSREYVERPLDGQPYRDGFANYAGLNFRAPATGRSFIAGQDTGNYPLTPRSKYYVRFGGVSGIHESASFPSSMTLYGFPFTFISYRLSYLDSANWESRTDGSVLVQGPSSFNMEFERMKFLCRGNLDSAQVPAGVTNKHLLYWNADIKPLSIQFKPKASDPCSLTERFLVLGVETKLPFIPQAFHTSLGFKPNGNLVTLATKVEGVDSRFPIPANLTMQGPAGSTWDLSTAGAGYFNNWETPGRPNAGFYSIVGRVRLPFFRATKVHLHVTPTGPTTSQIALMGGWAAEDGKGTDLGWKEGTQNYFNTAGFDADHNGWPVGVSLANYRNSPTEDFHPRAQQNWIQVATFDYPMTWNSVLREFSGFVDAKVVLPVIDVNSRLKQVTPGKVDLDFAQDINLQLPRIKLLDFANDALNEINAPFNTLSNAIRNEIAGSLNGITSGFRSLQSALRENAEGFFRPVLEPALNPVVDAIYPSLASALTVSKANLLANTPSIISSPANGLSSAVMSLNGAANQAQSVFGIVNKTLTDADDTLGLFIRVLEKDGGGSRHIVRKVIQKLVEDQGPALGFVGSIADPIVNGLLTDLEPTLAKVEAQMRELQSQFGDLRAQIGAATGDFSSALNTANRNAAQIGNYLQLAGGAVSNLLSSVVTSQADYFTADPARAKREIRERLVTAFLGSQIIGGYQSTLRQFLYDKNFVLDQLMSVLFDQINRSIRNGLSEQISSAADGVFQSMKGGGAIGGSFLSAKIRGAPTFEGESLRAIHLDADIQMNLPDEMHFTAYLDIKELTSQTTAISCIPAGGPAAEVTLGAKDISLSWLGIVPGSKLTLDVEARWTLQNGGVIGIGGSFEVKGKIGFKGCSLNGFGAAIAFGQIENYFAAKAGATVTILGIPVDFTAGIFAGHACSLEPLKFIDPEVDKTLRTPGEFIGIYLQFGGGLSLSEIIFGTSSCILDVGAEINTTLYYQGGPRLGAIGGRQKLTVNVDLICLISATAELAVFMRLDSIGVLTVGGEARLCAKVGPCPFCVKLCGEVTIIGTVGDGGVDYSIE